MKQKLTISLNDEITRAIRELAKEHRRSVSNMMEMIAREGILRFTTKQEDTDGNH